MSWGKPYVNTLYSDHIFNHHDPKNNNIHYEYFTRCVRRFINLLAKESNKLFIITFSNCTNNLDEMESIKKQIIELNDCILTKTKNHYIFVIYHILTKEVFKTSIEDINNIKFVSVNAKSYSNGRRLIDKTENKMLQEVFLNSYSFRATRILNADFL